MIAPKCASFGYDNTTVTKLQTDSIQLIPQIQLSMSQ